MRAKHVAIGFGVGVGLVLYGLLFWAGVKSLEAEGWHSLAVHPEPSRSSDR